uniref:Ribosomal protein L16 n=1 Tax=Rhodomonas salina TaxID=3034 RepID=Q9G8W7_RHDSA|nr:ribosomal protein L16 [Rhodomonas salina]AAG17730.1 ribosomal protein L16 [Rhodomonas salina]
MLLPRKTRFKKYHQKCYKVKENKNLSLSKGNFGLKSIQNKEFNAKQLETARKSFLKKGGKNLKIWFNCFPHFPKTKKAAETRMGKGKGNTDYWYSFIKTGKIIFEFDNFNRHFIQTVKKSDAKKLPFKTKLIFKKF